MTSRDRTRSAAAKARSINSRKVRREKSARLFLALAFGN